LTTRNAGVDSWIAFEFENQDEADHNIVSAEAAFSEVVLAGSQYRRPMLAGLVKVSWSSLEGGPHEFEV